MGEESTAARGVSDLIARIANDREHGASWIARAALRVVGQCAERSRAATPAELLSEVRDCAEALSRARPGMAPVRFWLEWLVRDLSAAAENSRQAGELRSVIGTLVASLVAESERATRVAAENAVARLAAGSVIFTASFSGTVLEACRLAQRAGRLQRVLAAESTDPAGHSHGHALANALRREGIDVEVVADDLMARHVSAATLIWLGADRVLIDGSIVNGVPSLRLAEAARQAQRPVDVVCESAKFDRWTALDAVVTPPGFDRVPADLLHAVVTEKGAGGADSGPTTRDRQDGGAESERVSVTAEAPIPESASSVSAEDLVARIASRLIARNENLAVAESAAGGRICDLLTDRPGSSAWFAGGILPYANSSKQRAVGIAAETLAQFGAVSGELAAALADGARRLFDTAWGIGETGIAGPPSGRRSSKPAGLGHVAVVGPGGFSRTVGVTTGSDLRAQNKQAFAIAALVLLAEALEKLA